MLLVGLIFVLAGLSINPATNCDEDGNCAPWLVYAALLMGIAACVGAIRMLWMNPQRGSYVDRDRGELIWWTNLRQDPDLGSLDEAVHRIPIAAISRIKIDYTGDNSDIFLYDAKGQELSFPGSDVIPMRNREWINALVALFPHIQLEMTG